MGKKAFLLIGGTSSRSCCLWHQHLGLVSCIVSSHTLLCTSHCHHCCLLFTPSVLQVLVHGQWLDRKNNIRSEGARRTVYMFIFSFLDEFIHLSFHHCARLGFFLQMMRGVSNFSFSTNWDLDSGLCFCGLVVFICLFVFVFRIQQSTQGTDCCVCSFLSSFQSPFEKVGAKNFGVQ